MASMRILDRELIVRLPSAQQRADRDDQNVGEFVIRGPVNYAGRDGFRTLTEVPL